MADDVGLLLLRAGLVAPEQLAAARQEVENVGGTVPEQLVQHGHIEDEELTSFYRNRLLIPRVNPSDLAKLSGRLLEKLPSDMATEFRSIPVSLDREGNLTLVMSDPSDTGAVDEIGFFTGSYVLRAIATQAQIAWCLAHYYQQKTALYLGLVADGQWPATDRQKSSASERDEAVTQEVPQQPDPREAETVPIAVRPREDAKVSARAKTRADTEEMPEFQTAPAKLRRLERPSNQKPSPPELFARAGEIKTVEQNADHSMAEEGPAVVISTEVGGVLQSHRKVSDTAPILLTALRKQSNENENDCQEEEDTGPILLKKMRRKGASARRTSVGLGAVGGEKPKSEGRSVSGVIDAGPTIRDVKEATDSKAGEARTVDLVGGDWGAPGTTIPPGYLGPFSAFDDPGDTDVDPAVPVPIDDTEATAQIQAHVGSPSVKTDADDTATSKAPAEVQHTSAEDAASKMLLALRAVDRADDKDGVVEPLLSFLDQAFARTGFLAVKRDDLVSWRLHGCPDGTSATLCIAKDSTFKDVVRMRLPFNGPLEDPVSKQLARDLDVPDAADLLVLPIALRERVIGVFFALSSFDSIHEEHITVLCQAAGEAFERIVLAQRT